MLTKGIKITDLPITSTINGSSVFVTVQNNETYQINANVMAGFFGGNVSPGSNIVLYHNGNLNSSQTRLNLVGGTNITLTDVGNGNIIIAASGGAGANINFADAIVPTGNINGNTTIFTLPNSPNPSNSVQLFLNGVLQSNPGDFSITGNTITYVRAPISTSKHISYYRF
jgi:hypothetical protein